MKVMRRALIAAFLLVHQTAAPLPEPKNWTAAQDHQQMMDQLGITSLRPGPSGNEQAPNHANYEEALANPFPDLPEDPLLELAQFLLVVGVVEAEHRHAMHPRGERFRGPLSHPLRGAVGRDQFRELRLQVPQLALEPVVLRVGDLRLVGDVVEVLVPAHLAPQLLDAVFSLFAGQ